MYEESWLSPGGDFKGLDVKGEVLPGPGSVASLPLLSVFPLLNEGYKNNSNKKNKSDSATNNYM